ncbi:hypothetical protein Sp245p_25985 (plasmid) [Azospirillum baldaniorum]|uniref:Uncharacterized protein n=1 Tax=Azospirillum baldaniorum TaxID=1064539 RepID=A0A9P1NRB3_9PROT|nr:hypothetical protein Sp245p_25985 [Azospirillum baldaniorum]CCD02929.1 protein of unknown function [Azospirillum baldaniorum]
MSRSMRLPTCWSGCSLRQSELLKRFQGLTLLLLAETAPDPHKPGIPALALSSLQPIFSAGHYASSRTKSEHSVP